MTNNIPESIQRGIDQAARGEGRLIDTDNLPTDDSDAVFREALKELIASARANPHWPVEQNDLPGQLTVERLYAERQGEEYEVRNVRWGAEVIVLYKLGGMILDVGDKVRVTKVEGQ